MATRMAEMATNLQDGRVMGQRAMATLERIELLLEQAAGQTESDPAMLCVTDDEAPPQVVTKDFPYEGSVRAIVQRTPVAVRVPPLGVEGLLCDVNVNRLGGTIVNKAAAGLTIFFCNEAGPQAGDGSIWIAPNGTWDFKLGNLLWCGHVYGRPDSGAITVAGCEF